MSGLSQKIMKATVLSVALMGGAAVATTMLAPDMAVAKSDKSKGKSKSSSKKSSASSSSASGLKAPNGKGNAIAQALGIHPSLLGSLNAANNKSENLNPNSTVGKINLFEQAVADGLVLEGDLQSAEAFLATLTEPAAFDDTAYADILAAIAAQEDAQAAYDSCDAATDDDACAGELTALTDADTAVSNLQGAYGTDYDYYVAYNEVELLQGDVETAMQEQYDYLDSAANKKDYLDQIYDAWRTMLGGIYTLADFSDD